MTSPKDWSRAEDDCMIEGGYLVSMGRIIRDVQDKFEWSDGTDSSL